MMYYTAYMYVSEKIFSLTSGNYRDLDDVSGSGCSGFIAQGSTFGASLCWLIKGGFRKPERS